MSNHTDLTEPAPTRNTGISLPPGTLLGIVGGRPVYNIAGGSGEGDDSGNDEGGDSDGDDDDSSGEAGSGVEDDDTGSGETDDAAEDKPKPKPPAPKAEEFKPPSKAEWERTKDALKKANDDAKRNRFRAKELEEAARTNESEQEKSIREAREQGEGKYRTPLVKAAARAALAEAGVNGSTERVLPLLKTADLTVDDEGDVVGLEMEIDRVKEAYPEFFQSAKPKPKPKPTGAGREPAPERPKSSAEIHAARLLSPRAR